jgi:AcrR family transcriptional regulator
VVGKRLRGAERRRQILKSSAERLAVHGYAETTMDDLAAAAGISKPVLYDHFPSKEMLYLEVLRSLRDNLLISGEAEIVRGSSIEAGYEAAVSFLFDFARAAPHEAMLLFTPPHGEPGLAEAAREIQDGATRHLAAIVVRTFPTIEPAAAPIISEYVKCGLHGAILWWLRNPQVPPEDAKAATKWISWSGLGGIEKA